MHIATLSATLKVQPSLACKIEPRSGYIMGIDRPPARRMDFLSSFFQQLTGGASPNLYLY